jgi:hypothetical protein
MSLATITNAAVAYRNHLAHAIAGRYGLDAKELASFVEALESGAAPVIAAALPSAKRADEGPKAEEPKAEEPKAEEPKAEEPKAKTKKVKDPNAPKRPLSAYMIFSADNRAEVAAELQGQPVTAVAKALGARWKELDEDGKKPFEARAAELKAEYTRAMEAYAPPAGLEAPAPKVKAAKPEREVPSIPLPFCGVKEDWCQGIRNNRGLYTQCTVAPMADCRFCKTCSAQAEKNATNLPNGGVVEGRDAAAWRAPNGQQPLTYASYLQKDAKHGHILQDHTIAEQEAAKCGWTIPDSEWEVTPRANGRPKQRATATVSDSSSDDGVAAMSGQDVIAALVAEASTTLNLPKEKAPVKAKTGKPTMTDEEKAARKEARKEAKRLEKIEQKRAEKAARVRATADEAMAAAAAADAVAGPSLVEDTFVAEPDPATQVEMFQHEGATYLRDGDNMVYCAVTHTEVGIWDPATKTLQLDDQEDDSDGGDA